MKSYPVLAILAAVSALGPLGCGHGSSDTSTGDDSGAAVDATSDATNAGSDASGDDAAVQPGADTTVKAFDATRVYFGPSTNQRTVDAPVTFPSTGAYASITLHLALTCPTGGCDVWDRFGTLAIVRPAGTSDAGPVEQLIEIARFVTPYGLPPASDPQPSWDLDVTDLRPLLSGDVTLRAFIDTWVPQNVTNEGYGWNVTATFTMKGGIPAKLPVAAVPIWSWTTTNKEPTQVVYGDPTQPIASSLPPQTLPLPAGASSYAVRSFITGHGQGNLDNCSEFCSRKHTWTVGSTPNTSTVWRTDCNKYPSAGTYQFPRAGWCPGTYVQPWTFDVTSQVGAAGGSASFAYDVESYVNTCDGAPDGGGPCTGCPAGGSCTYDGSGHTQPFYYVSALLIAYR